MKPTSPARGHSQGDGSGRSILSRKISSDLDDVELELLEEQSRGWLQRLCQQLGTSWLQPLANFFQLNAWCKLFISLVIFEGVVLLVYAGRFIYVGYELVPEGLERPANMTRFSSACCLK